MSRFVQFISHRRRQHYPLYEIKFPKVGKTKENEKLVIHILVHEKKWHRG